MKTITTILTATGIALSAATGVAVASPVRPLTMTGAEVRIHVYGTAEVLRLEAAGNDVTSFAVNSCHTLNKTAVLCSLSFEHGLLTRHVVLKETVKVYEQAGHSAPQVKRLS